MVAERHRYMTGVIKDGPPREIYCLIYSGQGLLCKQLVAWAANPLLSFDWKDITRVAKAINSPEGSLEGYRVWTPRSGGGDGRRGAVLDD
jgi:hypothetical protein